jgi:hypothetical protein
VAVDIAVVLCAVASVAALWLGYHLGRAAAREQWQARDFERSEALARLQEKAGQLERDREELLERLRILTANCCCPASAPTAAPLSAVDLDLPATRDGAGAQRAHVSEALTR